MKPRRVRAPDGSDWTIRRVWLPRAPKWIGLLLPKGKDGQKRTSLFDGLDIPVGGGDELGCVVVMLGIVALVGLIGVGVPVLIFVFDLLIVALLVVLGVLARVLLRRPWLIRVESPGEERTYRVVGWRRSHRALDEIEKTLHRGARLPEKLRAQG